MIISGGGARGAFAVGALKALQEKGMLDFDLIAGASTGGLIAPLALTKDLGTLIDIYTNTSTSQVVRKRFLPFALLFGDSIYDTTPLENLIRDHLPEAKADTVLNSKTRLFIATTELQSGRAMYFSNGKCPHPDLDSAFTEMTSPAMLRRVMLASSNQPIFMPPIEINRKQYMDGGLRDISPVRVALLLKIPDITIIDMIPVEDEVEHKSFKRIPDLIGRGLDIMSREIVEGDIASAKNARAKLTIIKPLKTLNKNPLDFDPKAMRKMLEIGYNRANEVLG